MLVLEDRPHADIRPLRAHCSGDVVVPGERVWDEVVDAWDGLAPGREPAAIVYPASGYDLAAVKSYARYAGLTAVVEGEDDLPADVRSAVLVRRPATRPPWAA